MYDSLGLSPSTIRKVNRAGITMLADVAPMNISTVDTGKAKLLFVYLN